MPTLWDLEAIGLWTSAAITLAVSLWAIAVACRVLFGVNARRRR
jgi:hypothetical protein